MSTFRSSFINTSLQADIGVGSTSELTIPGIKIGEYEILSFKGQILFANVNLKYQQGFTPWLSLYLNYSIAGRTGADLSTLVVDGLNTLNGGEIGWLIRLKQTDRFNFSTSIYVQNLTGNFYNISNYFSDIINNEPYPQVSYITPAMTIGTGLYGAYAFNSKYGLQFHGELLVGESFEREVNKAYFSLGAVGDVDFNPQNNVPVGFALGYLMSSEPEVVMNNSGITNVIMGKIAYTGSDEFELGLQLSVNNLDIESVEDKTFITKAIILLKFYF
jgi:hypothetical protein